MATIHGGLGDSNLIGADGEANTLYGDLTFLYSLDGGNDTLIGGNNSTDNTLYGDAAIMDGDVEGGNDTLTGGDNSTNTLYGDAAIIDGSVAGDDTLTGGGAGSTNKLYGDALVMKVNATGGDDRLISGHGDDEMWGDAAQMDATATGGNDTFVFGLNNGHDIIHDFNQGEDLIELNGFATLIGPIPEKALARMPAQALSQVLDPYSFSDLQIDEQNGNSIIHFDADNSITVVGVTGLTASDFDFIA